MSPAAGRRILTAVVGPAIVALLVAVVFIADTATPWQVAVGAFYAIAILTAVFFYDRRGVLIVSGICVALGLLSFVITQETVSAVLTEITAVGATTYLGLKIKSAEAAVREARIQVAHFGRLTVLGELAASIAHEVNQPLAAVVTNSNAALLWLERQPPDLGEARQALTRIARDANRASDLVARVRRLASKRTQRADLVDLNAMITEILSLTRHQIGEARVNVQTDLADDLPAVHGDWTQLQQVVLNLLLNAVDAVTAGERQLRQVTVKSEPAESGSVIMTVSDTGGGIDRSIADRIFEPFFTTKAEGMGMGLAISRSIVEAHGGRIWATADGRTGAAVHVQLPGVPSKGRQAKR